MVDILYQNDQWMLQSDDGIFFIVEKRSRDVTEHLPKDQIVNMTPDDLIRANEGYWFEAERLARKDSEDYNPVYHIGQKTWVELDLFEDAARKTFSILGLVPDFDVEGTFRRLRIEMAQKSPQYRCCAV